MGAFFYVIFRLFGETWLDYERMKGKTLGMGTFLGFKVSLYIGKKIVGCVAADERRFKSRLNRGRAELREALEKGDGK